MTLIPKPDQNPEPHQIPEPHKKVPMLFRAQINGRCQLQRLIKGQEPDVTQWVDEWTDKTYPELPTLPPTVKTREYKIQWRLITNAGMDDSAIRPVIGGWGWPYYPGSSMKGLFRRACNREQAAKYCGKVERNHDFRPGSLRFHGGYPIDTSWQDHLVDVVHPQQAWQVETQTTDQKSGGAFAQVSLYQPTLRFGISSADATVDWQEVWEIWERAIAQGLGSRVCAGYGQVQGVTATQVLYKTRLRGQGQAPKRLDGEGEFRPNVFRAAIRGHALRIFAGLIEEKLAKQLVETLFGGVQGRGTVGMVQLQFQPQRLEMDRFGAGNYAQPTYNVEGELSWVWARSPAELESMDLRPLKKLMEKLTQFAMVFGGFGKSWRRADHRLFFEEYYEDSYKALIGCHWQWSHDPALWRRDVQVHKLDQVSGLIDRVRQAAIDWMTTQGVTVQPIRSSMIREAWHPANCQVWGRIADSEGESEAIRWLHQPYQPKMQGIQPEGSIYKTSLTGEVSQVGRIWHRMYPWVRLVKDPENPSKPKTIATPKFLEFLTIFPDESQDCEQFLQFLAKQPFGFQKLWGD